MPNTPRMNWDFPGENDTPWFERLEAFFFQQDGAAFAAREDRHIIFQEGGIIGFDGATGTVSWSGDLDILAAITGFQWRLLPSSFSLDDGQLAYITLSRAPTLNVTVTVATASQVPNTDNALIFCVRRGNRVYFRNGVSMVGGETLDTIAGGTTIAGVTQAVNASVLGTTFILVGSIRLPVGVINAASSRVMLGTDQVADTADLEIRRFTGGLVIGTLSATGVLQDVQPGADIVVPADDWYDLYLKADVVTTNALLRGIKLVFSVGDATEISQAFDQEQTGTTPLLVGSVFLPVGTLQAASRVMLGTGAGGTATLELRRFTGGALLATWTQTGALQDTLLGASVAVADADWYDITIFGDAGPTVAQIKGLDWTVT